jgi:long-subunit fatty acid transport protein
MPDINIAYLSGYRRIDTKQVLSMSLTYSSLGDVPFTDEFGDLQRTFTPNEFAMDAAYARLFSEHFSGGVAFRFIYSNLAGGTYSGVTANKPGTSFAADISSYYRNNISVLDRDGQLAVGLNLSNIGSKINYSTAHAADFIPMDMRLGTAMTVNLDRYNKLTVAVDVNKLLVSDSVRASVPSTIVHSFSNSIQEVMYSAGLEYWYNDQFALRSGYHYENQMMSNSKYFTVGMGFKYKAYEFDFSYLVSTAQSSPLANTVRFSIAWNMKR